MPLDKSRLLASVKRSAAAGPKSDAAHDDLSLAGDKSQPTPAPILTDVAPIKTPTIVTSATRPKADPKLGKSTDEQRKWVREELRIIESKRSKVAADTVRKYEKAYVNLDTLRDETGTIPVSALGDNENTFYLNRAALIYMAAEKARAAISEYGKADDSIRAAKSQGDTAAEAQARSDKERALQDMLRAGNDLARHPAGKAGQYVAAQTEFRANVKEYKAQPKQVRDLMYEKPTKPSKGAHKTALQNGDINKSDDYSASKRAVASMLQKRYPAWRDLGYDHVSKKWKTFTAVASVTGCRPEEIVGIRYGIDKDNPDFLSFEIHGAKVKHDSKKGEVTQGIEVRKFSIREKDSKAFAHLLALAQQGPQIVSAPTKGNGIPLSDINSAFRNALNQAGKKFIKPQRKDAAVKMSLSPYCFRHQFACDLKADAYGMKTIAITLGHSSTRTQQMYGRSNSGVKKQRELLVDEMAYRINEVTRTPQPDSTPEPDIRPSIGNDVTDVSHNVPTQTFVTIRQTTPAPTNTTPPTPGSSFDIS